MCGIAGLLGFSGDKTALESVVGEMADVLVQRGPDDRGVWTDAKLGVGLGFRRLAILDLSQEGHQPMRSPCGRYVIVFNGEIYNFQELRKEIEATGRYPHPFRGHSDTEVLLAAFTIWPVPEVLSRLVGMFAIALWDAEEQRLYLSRDRLGIKPLYYGFWKGHLLFGSELKSLKKFPGFSPAIDLGALGLFFRHNYIPAPYSIYQEIFKLSPGTFLCVDRKEMQRKILPEPFWSAKRIAESGSRSRRDFTETEALKKLESCLEDAVKIRMIADVPLGAFLSGGVDSSTVVALMQKNSTKPIQTFTIGFSENEYNEAKDAKAVAKHLGTDHTELYVRPEEAMAVIPKLAGLYDEPFADSSQIPTYLVSELARRKVTVALSGDGGDELFAGYNRYFWGRKIWDQIAWVPTGLRHLGGKTLSTIPTSFWDSVLQSMGGILPESFKVRNPADKIQKLSQILGMENPEVLYKTLVSHWKSPGDLLINPVPENPSVLTDKTRWPDLEDFTERMMFFDLVSYLPDDILAKVDRASMGVSLEVRVPILDHRVVALAWELPLDLKIREGKGKYLLRKLLYQYVPSELIERPKMGFAVPIDSWLRGPLRDWAESLLSESQIRQEGYLNAAPIRQKWEEHLSGKRNWQYEIWDVLMFQSWLAS